MNNRRGFTLIELIVVLSGTAIMMLIGVGTLHTLLRSERGTTGNLVYSQAAARLSTQLREDIHEATAAEPSEQGTQLQLLCPDNRRIVFTQNSGEIFRLEATGNTTQRRETYQKRVGVSANFSTLDDGGNRIIRMEFVRELPIGQTSTMAASQAVRPKSPPWSVEAVLAKDHRFDREEP